MNVQFPRISNLVAHSTFSACDGNIDRSNIAFSLKALPFPGSNDIRRVPTASVITMDYFITGKSQGCVGLIIDEHLHPYPTHMYLPENCGDLPEIYAVDIYHSQCEC